MNKERYQMMIYENKNLKKKNADKCILNEKKESIKVKSSSNFRSCKKHRQN